MEAPIRLVSALLARIRKWATLLVLLLMLGFTVASHTVGYLSNLTGQVIQTVTGLTTTTMAARQDLRKQRQNANLIDNSNAELSRKYNNLASQHRLDQDVIAKLSQSTVTLERANRDQSAHIANLTRTSARLSSANFELQQRADGLSDDLVRIRRQTTQTLQRIQKRTSNTAASNFFSTFGESIPFYGIAVVVGATSFELKMACGTMTDLYELQVATDPESAIPEDRDEVCGLKVPTREELWQIVRTSPRAAWDRTVSASKGTAEWVATLDPPDFTKASDWLLWWWDAGEDAKNE